MGKKIEVSMWKFIPPRERAKFLVMITAAVVLAAAMIITPSLYRNKNGDGNQAASDDLIEPAVQTDESVLDEPEGAGPSLQQPEATADVEPEADELYDPALLDEVVDNTSDVTLEGLLLLVHWLQGMSQEQIIEQTDTSVRAENLLDDPAGNRGKIVYVDGNLESIYKRRLGTNSTGAETIYFGRLNHIGENTQPVGFYLLDGPLGAGVGDSVVLRGYFLSLWRPEGKNETLPVIVARRFDKPAWLTDPESLAKVTEGSFFREDFGVYYLMEKALNTSRAELSAAVDESLDGAELASHGEKHRGKAVRYTGTIIHIEKESEPNPTGNCEFHTGFLLDKDNNTCMFYIVEPPDNVKLNDLVQLDGYFMKNYRYVSGQSVEREASVIIGRRLVPVEVDTSNMYWAIFGICGAALIIVLTAGMLDTRAVMRRRREAWAKGYPNMRGSIQQAAKEATRKARPKS